MEYVFNEIKEIFMKVIMHQNLGIEIFSSIILDIYTEGLKVIKHLQ